MQGLYQLSRLSKKPFSALPVIPNQRFYRLWIVEDHAAWQSGSQEQQLDLSGTLWFFPKHYKPGIPHQEIEGFTFWFDDIFLKNNPILAKPAGEDPWAVTKPFLLSTLPSFSAILNLCRDHQTYLSNLHSDQHPLGYTTATLLLLHLREAASDRLTLGTPNFNKTPIEPFLNLIDRHFAQEHQPGFYAEALHLTLPTLRRYCKEALNQTPTELIQQKLVDEAKRLLLDSTLSIKEIAFALGFEDESYFVRFFRQQALLPPQAYRRSFLLQRS